MGNSGSQFQDRNESPIPANNNTTNPNPKPEKKKENAEGDRGAGSAREMEYKIEQDKVQLESQLKGLLNFPLSLLRIELKEGSCISYSSNSFYLEFITHNLTKTLSNQR
jgi:hypothetical protein